MRDLKVDTLRAVAILSILLAHSGVKYFIFNLRSFDVPLMAFCLGISYYYSSKDTSYFNYIKKRIKRLLLPTFLFLIILFDLFYIVDFLLDIPYQFNFNYIIHSFYMDTSYGYGWIMRTFFLICLIIPFFYKLGEKVSKVQSMILIFFFLVVIQYFLIRLGSFIPKDNQYYYEQILLIPFGYCPIVFLGILAKKINVKSGIKISFIMFFSLIISLYVYGFSGFNTFKYPPEAPYIFYGTMCSIVLWLLTQLFEFRNPKVINSIVFLSKNSQKIYFVHVFYIFIYEFYLRNTLQILNMWEFNYIYLLLTTLLTVFIINIIKIPKIIDKICS